MTRFICLIFLSAFFACSSDYNPDKQLSAQQKDELMSKTIRYLAKLPEKATEADKFESKYDDYYQKRMSEAVLEQYCKKGNDHYFLISQPAPSLTVKRHATGGRLKIDEEGNIKEYEEVFRTWKMVPDTLKKRSYLLFDKMVNGESLAPYYAKNSGTLEYIEFPDERTYYDKESRKWKVKMP